MINNSKNQNSAKNTTKSQKLNQFEEYNQNPVSHGSELGTHEKPTKG